VWDGVRKGIALQFSKFPPFAQKIVNTLIDLKWWLMERNLPTVILDMILFNKVKANLGGRLRAALSGGAPISKDTQRFLSTLICPIIQGYGATETCGVIAVQVPPRVILGVVGEPVPCGEIKLVDVPDAGYFSSNQPYPQGEIWIRGDNVMRGYYKKPELTKEALTDDGWFMSGSRSVEVLVLLRV
jgi:long-chain acyl-CoA synthetase